MKLSTLYIASLAFLPSLISAVAIPDADNHKATLGKRGGEINYLADCYRQDWDEGVNYHASYMAWYSNSDNSVHGEQPKSLSSEYRNWASNGGGHLLGQTHSYVHMELEISLFVSDVVIGDWLTWEGQNHSIYFPGSGVTVNTNINSGAGGLSTGQAAGTVQRTSDWKTFQCYKDNGRYLFEKRPPVPDGTNRLILCYAKYYCV
ncbi:hypothetical protein FS837_010157 [Tulasnella sp. UAMH 9824]|nr:hypothetical protein FS837_010157 [Tulasnella sp. UAMH 9824]